MHVRFQNSCKKRAENAFQFENSYKKEQKWKKESTFIWIFFACKLQKYICKKKAENNISKKHAKKSRNAKKAAKKAGAVYNKSL